MLRQHEFSKVFCCLAFLGQQASGMRGAYQHDLHALVTVQIERALPPFQFVQHPGSGA
jgi:hypothetical protein